MQHTSYSFPSHILPLLDLALVLLAALVLWGWRRRGKGPYERAGAGAQLLTWAPKRPAALVGTLGFTGTLLAFLAFGTPVPTVVDEHAYLLAAETFASGRLAAPTPEHPRHFEAPHVFQVPVRASKYPPAQGLLLALGRVIGGTPAFGLLLAAGLLGASMVWCLRGWMPAPWAFVGGLVVLLRLGVGGYWNQTYWGGSVAAIGGALVYGALPRLRRRPHPYPAAAFALGLAILANSRPFEGLLVALPAVASLGISALSGLREPGTKNTGRRLRHLALRGAAPMLAVLLPVALWMGHYNRTLTGDPWLLPHVGHRAAYDLPAEFVFQSSHRPTAYRNQQRPPAWPSGDNGPAEPWLGTAVAQGLHRASLSLFFYLGLASALPLATWFLGRRAAGAELPGLRAPGPWIPAAGCALVLLGGALTRVWFPHYPAPMAAPLLVLALGGLRRLSHLSARNKPPRAALAVAVLTVQAVLFGVQLPAHRPDPGSTAAERLRIQSTLETRPGQDLVFVDRAGHPSGPWMANPPDLGDAGVLWAHDLGPDANCALLAAYPGREPWLLDLGEEGPLQVEPFDPCR
ncbi:MAG: hypothetical protein AAGD06_00830 [Acidobacteriota bacterium]